MKRLLVSLTLVAAACTPSIDVAIRNPVIAQQVAQNQINKAHRWQEERRGLPVGALSDSAQLLSADQNQVCIGVTMHELAAIDPNQTRGVLSSKGLEQKQPTIFPNQPNVRTYSGLVPTKIPTGWETYCVSRNYNNYCTAWDRRQLYAWVMRPGPVDVYESSMRACFPNGGVLTAMSDYISLDIKAPLQGLVDGGWGIFSLSHTKAVRFTWGLAK